MLAVRGWLSPFLGDTRQQRWESSRAEAGTGWRFLIKGESMKQRLGHAPALHVSQGLLVVIGAEGIVRHIGRLEKLSGNGPGPYEQLIDSYDSACPPVYDLLVG